MLSRRSLLLSAVSPFGPGETLRHLVRKAGGLTKDAYLFGAEFTRELTRTWTRFRTGK